MVCLERNTTKSSLQGRFNLNMYIITHIAQDIGIELIDAFPFESIEKIT